MHAIAWAQIHLFKHTRMHVQWQSQGRRLQGQAAAVAWLCSYCSHTCTS